MKYSVLVVDDDRLVNELYEETLKREGYACKTVFSAEEAVAELNERSYDIILSDLKMKSMGGIELLAHVKKQSPETVMIMMTAYGTVEDAVKSIKIGAYDFLIKPVLPETLELMLKRVSEMLTLRAQNERMRQDLEEKFQNIVGKSKIMREVYDLIRSVASARSTVMITGQSGTGKELVARAIHYSSNRKDGPFIKLNCAALPETLVETELFGHEKGAFTDAKKAQRGRFELADGGTLLLDEVSEMPLNLQAKLLRVLQEREFERVGSGQTISVDVRIIATSNRNLKEYVSAGKFREDLYFRLNVIPIHLPQLADRQEDIPPLVNHFIQKYALENEKPIKGITPEALGLFMKYHWPGNVRELEHQIERAVVTSKEEYLTADDFPVEMTMGALGEQLPMLRVPMRLEDAEKYLILKTLELYNWNKTKAAEALDITTRTIRNKLAEYHTISEN